MSETRVMTETRAMTGTRSVTGTGSMTGTRSVTGTGSMTSTRSVQIDRSADTGENDLAQLIRNNLDQVTRESQQQGEEFILQIPLTQTAREEVEAYDREIQT